jgi:hypothetical protein
LAQHHGHQISEIENLIVFERDLYLQLLADHIKKQEDMVKDGG